MSKFTRIIGRKRNKSSKEEAINQKRYASHSRIKGTFSNSIFYGERYNGDLVNADKMKTIFGKKKGAHK